MDTTVMNCIKCGHETDCIQGICQECSLGGNVTESIFTSDTLTISMADVQHIENNQYGLMIITKHTKWNFEHDCWENAISLPKKIENKFMKAFCTYRHELELGTLKDLRPDADKSVCDNSCPFKTFR